MLYQLAFRPLVPLLGNVRKLFLSPDGQLSLVSFAALHDGRRFLIDAWDITYLTSGNELLPRLADIPAARSVAVLADPDFGSPLAAPVLTAQPAPVPLERSAPLERFFSSVRAELTDRPFPPLPGTRKEAEAIHRLFPEAQILLGSAATKEALLKLPTPGILHLATHGFFLEDAATPATSRGVGHFGAVAEAGPVQRPPDPLLRSGLVLAGAHSMVAPAASPRLEDSLVTALELAGLDLWGTQLVVLSACDTGRGDVKLGQGVYGLRPALMVSGAETVVTSLWKVNDETTQELMETYYRHLLMGQGRTTALRQAMLALRQKRPHPYFWAPFIALGRDAPFQRLTPPTAAQCTP
jgi:CHAT domain-containing protein